MNKKTAIIVKNCNNPKITAGFKRFSEHVLLNTVFDDVESNKTEIYEQFCLDNKFDGLLFVEQDEEIKHFDSNGNFDYVCITDGDWIIKPKRYFSCNQKYSNIGMPSILKKQAQLKGIKLDDSFSFFKNLYEQKNYNQFVVEVEKWFFHNIKNYSKNIMLRYYACVVYFIKFKKTKEGLIQLTQGLLGHPQYSELWCLWGDYLVENKRYHEAYEIYDSAIKAGKQRNLYDDNPVWLKKYDQYPSEMMQKIKKLIDNTQIYALRTEDQVHLQ